MIEEYRRSLKMAEAEEILDLALYRPLAYTLVRTLHRLPVTPNQVTILSLVAGVIAAWAFSLGTSVGMVWGAILYGVANVLDCADGQLARLQNSGTLLGRVIDGMVDYIVSAAVFVGIGIGFSGNAMWWLVVLAGVSSGLHAMFFDRYQNEFISSVRGEQNFLVSEHERFTDEVRRMAMSGQDRSKRLILRIYVWYLRLQQRLGSKQLQPRVDRALYRKENSVMIRLWTFLGPTTNRTLLIVSALAGRADLYLYAIFIVGNVWLVLCLVLQHQTYAKMQAAGVHAEIEDIEA